MRVKFKKPDPRAGQVAELPDDQAQKLIDDGNASKAADDAVNDEPTDPAATGSHGVQAKDQADKAVTRSNAGPAAAAKTATGKT